MDKSRLFDTINKINSVLLLLLFTGGIILVLTGIVMSNQWQNRRAVKVAEKPGSEHKMELILGNIADVPGYSTQYVKLTTRRSGGKFSSSYGGGEMRNVLFFSGNDLDTHWLYEDHNHYITNFQVLSNDQNPPSMGAREEKKTAVAIYVKTIPADTSGNGVLDRGDLSNIALLTPDGKNLTEIERGIQSVIDYNLSEDDQQLVLLLQKQGQVILKKYSLSSFELISEKVIEEITGKH
jgi:hypothetical protein